MRVLAVPRDVPCRDASLSSAVSFSFARAEIEKRTEKIVSYLYLLEKILSYPFPPNT